MWYMGLYNKLEDEDTCFMPPFLFGARDKSQSNI